VDEDEPEPSAIICYKLDAAIQIDETAASR